MFQFLLRRLFLILFILFTISLLIFAVTEILPGDAAQMILGQQATPETLAALRTRLGLDQPAYLRYLQWIGGVLRGDWGESLVMDLPVGPILAQRLRNSLTLGLLALLFGTPLGILGGVIAGLNRGRWVDRSITIFTIFTVSFPSFVTAIFLIILLASWLRWLPASSLIPPDANLWASARYLVLPVLTLVLGLLAQITLHTRNSLIEVLRSDYLRRAVSKGMPKRVVIVRHALRNALIP
ncbi:MAG: ABC transporter permease, partial [Caldilineaceae bacterium]|nr:ABC transporter permease [Caldilineaceae bacterium]